MTTSPSSLRFAHLELIIDRDERFDSLDGLAAIFHRTKMHLSPQETFWALAYGVDLNLATLFEVARGQYGMVPLHLPSLLSMVLMSGVERFVIAHNHPTTNCEPTRADVSLTKTVMKAANAVGLCFEDHLILTPDEQMFSFTTAGILVLPKDSPYAESEPVMAAGNGR